MSGHNRCAIYTRKSSEEGLEQSFNSLDAQREACESYIRSQRLEGWKALNTRFDDGGFSGGNMDRPALRKLIDDIAAGKVDTVVVYKVDRLTRSLTDFAKIIEQFDARKVSFVSVTQQFNTTTSMGRLTLNVLLSFAQFEREVTGERIRDKIAASKKKGMWMGGVVPLGYDVRDRKLSINPEEAGRVREIFNQYLRLQSLMALQERLDRTSIRTKARVRQGRAVGGGKFSRGMLNKILRSRLYIGEVAHHGNVYSGEHDAIIKRDVWDLAQTLLEQNRRGRRNRMRTTTGSLLTGLLFDAAGNRFTPTQAQKGAKRYRYYTSQLVLQKASEGGPTSRIPAIELENAVIERIVKFLESPGEVLIAARETGIEAECVRSVLKYLPERAKQWTRRPGGNQQFSVLSFLNKVVIHENSVVINVDLRVLLADLLGNKKQLETPQPCLVSLSCPLRLTSRGKGICLVVGAGPAASSESAAAILKAIARARLWYDQVVSGEVNSSAELAKLHGLPPRYVRKIFQCAVLGPGVVEAALLQKTKSELTLESLLFELPLCWKDQLVRCTVR